MVSPKVRVRMVGAACLALFAGACKDRAPEEQILTLSGTVEQIDLPRKKVRISFFSEKHGRNLTQDAQFTDRTEVIINGRAARLEDVKEGERADGEVIVSKAGEERVITITKVQIRRDAAIAAQPAQATTAGEPPVTQPVPPAGG